MPGTAFASRNVARAVNAVTTSTTETEFANAVEKCSLLDDECTMCFQERVPVDQRHKVGDCEI